MKNHDVFLILGLDFGLFDIEATVNQDYRGLSFAWMLKVKYRDLFRLSWEDLIKKSKNNGLVLIDQSENWFIAEHKKIKVSEKFKILKNCDETIMFIEWNASQYHRTATFLLQEQRSLFEDLNWNVIPLGWKSILTSWEEFSLESLNQRYNASEEKSLFQDVLKNEKNNLELEEKESDGTRRL